MPFDAQAFQTAANTSDDAPPDGEYDAELIDTTVVTANADGRQWAKLTWKALAGAQRDESWTSLHSLDAYRQDGEPNPGLKFTVQTLQRLTIDTSKIRSDESGMDDLLAAMREVRGNAYRVAVKRNGQFTNTYVNDWLANAAASLPGTGEGGEARPAQNAIFGADGPAQPQQRSLSDAAAGFEHVGGSDVTPPGAADELAVKAAPPKKGDIDPETGEPFPF